MEGKSKTNQRTPVHLLQKLWSLDALFENVGLGSLESFFHFDHQVNISFYLMESTTLRHYQSSCYYLHGITFSPMEAILAL
jgi:hypothetical protein